MESDREVLSAQEEQGGEEMKCPYDDTFECEFAGLDECDAVFIEQCKLNVTGDFRAIGK